MATGRLSSGTNPRSEEIRASRNGLSGWPSKLVVPLKSYRPGMAAMIRFTSLGLRESWQSWPNRFRLPACVLRNSKQPDISFRRWSRPRVAPGPSHFGACKPGDESHSSMWEAVSSWRALRKRASRFLPAGNVRACCLRHSASCAKRSRNVVACVKRSLCMTLLPSTWRGSADSALR
jgi:hypothetical protein